MKIEDTINLLRSGELDLLYEQLSNYFETKPPLHLKIKLCRAIVEALCLDEYLFGKFNQDLLDLVLFDQRIIQSLYENIFKRNAQSPSLVQFYIEKHSDFDTFLSVCCERINVNLLKVLIKIYGEDKVSKALEKNHKPSLDYYLNLTSPNTISKLAYQFMGEFGKITAEGVKLTCAEIKERKKDYDFSPVVCHSPEELKQLCKTIGENPDCTPPPITFIAQECNHWVSGQIDVDSNGTANILLLDSTGLDIKNEWLINCSEIINACLSQFEHTNIFFSREVRQTSPKGCSVFAIDDARHMQTSARYLPEQYSDSGLFGYIQVKSTQDEVDIMVKQNNLTPKPGQAIHLCTLPPHLKRAMQSRLLLTGLTEFPVNKRGDTEIKSANIFFQPEPVTKRLVNKRIEYKFDKMRDQNLSYMMRHTDAECETAMDDFSVDSFEKRLCHKSISPE